MRLAAVRRCAREPHPAVDPGAVANGRRRRVCYSRLSARAPRRCHAGAGSRRLRGACRWPNPHRTAARPARPPRAGQRPAAGLDRIEVGLDRIDAARLQLDERTLPVEEPRVPEGPLQSDNRFDLVPPLRHRLRRRRPDAYVGSDLFVNYVNAPTNREKVAPDLFVAFGVKERPKGSYALGPDRPAPSFVLEIVSERTWRDDRHRKPSIYAKLGVREYFLFDPEGRRLSPALVGYELRGGEYVPLPMEEGLPGGRRGVPSAVLGLVLCVPGSGGATLRWYDPAAGEYLRAPEESEARLEEEAAARREAETRAAAAETRAATAETRAATAETRAEMEAEARRAEAAARRQAEAETAALRSRLR